jgi:hypothetical protein
MKALIGITLFFAASAASAQSFEVASGDWREIPRVVHRGNFMMDDGMMARVDRLARAGTCSVPGLRRDRIDLDIPFLMQFAEDGSVQRIVIHDTGCPELEAVIGGVIHRKAQAGDYRPTGENIYGWYRGDFRYISS